VTRVQCLILAQKYMTFNRTSAYVAVVLLAVVAFGVSESPALAKAQTGASLQVNVSGLPAGVSGHVLVSGPAGYRRVVRSTVTLNGLRAGRYRLRVSQVRVARGVRRLPAGSVAFPTHISAAVVVHPGRLARTGVLYGTIRSSLTHVLSAKPFAVSGPSTAPNAITLTGTSGLAVGSIVAAAPSTMLPAGLFDRVTSVSRRGRRATFSLMPASLSQAFPELNLETTIPLLGLSGRSANAGDARAAGLNSIDLSGSAPIIETRLEAACGAPPVGWSFVPTASIQPSLTADIHLPFLQLPYGQLSISLVGQAGFTATIPSGAHCDLNFPGPRGSTFIPIEGIPVPVEAQVNVPISLATDGPVNASATAQLNVTGGMTFRGTSATAVMSAHPTASASLHGQGGSLSTGLTVEVGIGSLDVNGHASVTPQLESKFSPSTCELDLGLGLSTGLAIGPFSPSLGHTFSFPLYKCPGEPGSGGSPSPPGGNPAPKNPGGGGTGASGAATIAAGGEHTCAVLVNSTVKCWGVNGAGELGYGDTLERDAPPGESVDIGGAAVQVATGTYDHTCVLLSTGDVECWGDNSRGQLGYGNAEAVGQLDIPTHQPVALGQHAKQVIAGTDDSCALLSDGSVKCWGNNNYGQLGYGDTTQRDAPPIESITLGTSATQISGAYDHTCALLSDHSVKCWGFNDGGELGYGDTVQRDAPAVESIALGGPALQISAGYQHTCALLVEGIVKCWGNNNDGELGYGDLVQREAPAVEGVPLGGLATQVSAGYEDTCALLADGSVNCWGDNNYGQLGYGDINFRSAPPSESIALGQSATEITAGENYTCALLADSTVKCWGSNEYGELGDGTTESSSTPVLVSGIP